MEGASDGVRAAMEEGRDRPSEGSEAIVGRLEDAAAMEEGRDRPSEVPVRQCHDRGCSAAMEEGRDRPSEGGNAPTTRSFSTSRNGGGPRSALGAPPVIRLADYLLAAMEEGRDRPSEHALLPVGSSTNAPQWRRAEIGPRSRYVLGDVPGVLWPQWRRAEIGPRSYGSRGEHEQSCKPQWRRAEIGPRSSLPHPIGAVFGVAAMEEGRDRPSEWFLATVPIFAIWGRNGGGPRSALGEETARRGPRAAHRRNGGGPRSALGAAPTERPNDRPNGRNGGGPRSALGARRDP